MRRAVHSCRRIESEGTGVAKFRICALQFRKDSRGNVSFEFTVPSGNHKLSNHPMNFQFAVLYCEDDCGSLRKSTSGISDSPSKEIRLHAYSNSVFSAIHAGIGLRPNSSNNETSLLKAENYSSQC